MSGKEPNIRPTRRRTARFAIGFLPGARCPRKDYAGDAAEDSSNPKPSTAKYRSSGAFHNSIGGSSTEPDTGEPTDGVVKPGTSGNGPCLALAQVSPRRVPN